MRDYGKVYTSFWGDFGIKSLSEDARHLALYLLTCPHGTIAGVFRLPDGYVTDDIQWGSERVQKGFDELFQNGFATRCKGTKWVWINRFLEWNPPENPNQRKSIDKIVQLIPDDCSWKPEFTRVCWPSACKKEPLNPARDNPSETVPEPFLNQEQEQEQEQEQKQEQEKKTRASQRFRPSDFLVQAGADRRLVSDWLAVRSAKKLAGTETALRDFLTEVGKSGKTIDEILKVCVVKGWGGFDASWLKNQRSTARVEEDVFAGCI